MAGLQKSMKKLQEIRALHTEQCCLLCWQGYGVHLLWLKRLEDLLSNQSNRRIGLERLSTTASISTESQY